MTKLAEIQEAIQRLPAAERAELRHWLLEEETPEMLAAIDVGLRSLAEKVPASSRRKNLSGRSGNGLPHRAD